VREESGSNATCFSSPESEGRAEIHQTLETSRQKAQDAIQIMNQQTGMRPELRGLQGKLILWTTMAEGDLKQAPR
jgi:hypothetical protein